MTTGQTVIEVVDVVERILARCEIDTFNQTPDLINKARINLFYHLSNLSNAGTLVWMIDRRTLQLYRGQTKYTMPPGAMDLINVNRRTYVGIDGTVGGIVTQVLNAFLTLQQRVVLVGFDVIGNTNALENTITVETLNGATWTVRKTITQLWSGERRWVEIDGAAEADAVRVIVTGAGNATLDPSVCLAASSYRDLPLGMFNRDDWSNQSDKRTYGTVVNIYHDKQYENVLYVWQTPSDESQLLNIEYTTQGEDIPELYDNIRIPSRRLESVIDGVAYSVAKELPKTRMDGAKLQELQMAAKMSRTEADEGETDNGPTRLYPNIRVYTR